MKDWVSVNGLIVTLSSKADHIQSSPGYYTAQPNTKILRVPDGIVEVSGSRVKEGE